VPLLKTGRRRGKLLRVGPGRPTHSRQIHAQHLPVEEQQGSGGLPADRGRKATLVRQPGQEAFDLSATQSCWMPQAVKPSYARTLWT